MTIRTEAELLNPIFVDHKDGGITARDIRDFVESCRLNGAGLTDTDLTSAGTLTIANRYHADTTGGTFVATLPAAPVNGSVIVILDVKGFFGTNKLTLEASGGDSIEGISFLDLTIDYGFCELVYDEMNSTWVVLNEGTAGGDGNTFSTITIAGQSDVVADNNNDTLTLVAGTNIILATNPSTDTITISAEGGTQSTFLNIAVAGQDDVVADNATDTLTFVAGSNITITTNAFTDSVTIDAIGGPDQNVFTTIAVAGQDDIIADSTTDTLTFAAGSNITITTDDTTDTITIEAAGGVDQNVFTTIAVAGQDDIIADSTTDTLTFVAGSNITITTDDGTDSITINSTATPLVDTNINSTGTLAIGTRYHVDTTGSAFVVTLPNTPVNGSMIVLLDVEGSFNTNNLTITAGASDTIKNFSSIILSKNYSYAELVYDAANNTWVIQREGDNLNYDFTSQTSVNVVHNYASYPNVDVIDDTQTMIIPLNVVHNSKNDLTVYFTASTSGTIIVTGGGGDAITGGSLQNIFSTIAVSGQSNVVADTINDTLTLIAGTGVVITTDESTDSITITTTPVQNVFSTIAVSGQSNVVADSTTDTLTLVAGTNIAITTDNITNSITIATTGITGSNTGDQLVFKTIQISGQSDIVADGFADILTLVAGTGIAITTNAGSDSITIAATGGSGTQNVFSTIAVPGQSNIDADSTTDTLNFVPGTNIVITTNASTDTVTIATTGITGTNTGDQNIFQTIAVSGQPNVVADNTTDILTLVAGTNIAITTDNITDSITIATTGITGSNTGDQLVFKTIQVSGQPDVVADGFADILTLVAGTNIAITTNTGTDTITIATTGITGTNTGDQTITLSGDVSGSGTGPITTSIGPNKVTLGMMSTMATANFLGRTTAGTGNVESLTTTQATAMLNNMVGDSGSGGTKGLVPAPAAGDAAASKFLKADGTWAAAGGGSGWSLSGNSITSGQFLGTTNSQPLVIRTNNTDVFRILTSATQTISGLDGTQLTVQGGDGIGANGGALNLKGGTATIAGTGNGGNVSITSGSPIGSGSSAGNISITASNGTISGAAGSGGSISILAGNGNYASGSLGNGIGGTITIQGGTANAIPAPGGKIEAKGGINSGFGGDVVLTGGSANGGGNILITSGASTGAGAAGSITMVGANSSSPSVQAGNISLTPGTNTGGSLHGNVIISGLKYPRTDGTVNQFLQTNGAGQLAWATPAGGTGWLTTGNPGTTAGTNFIGTTDNQALVFKTNGVERFRISNLSNTLTAAAASSTTSAGNNFTINASAGGSTSGDGGSINMSCGTATSGYGGAFIIDTGTANDTGATLFNGGDFTVTAGGCNANNAAANAGNIFLLAGNAVTAKPGNITIKAGGGNTGANPGGTVKLQGGTGGNAFGIGGTIILDGSNYVNLGSIWIGYSAANTPIEQVYNGLAAGDVNIRGTNSNVSPGGSAVGGNVNVLGGTVTYDGNGGTVNIIGGDVTHSGTGGGVIITGGKSALANGGVITITGGSGRAATTGGAVTIQGGPADTSSGTGNGGQLNLKGGAGGTSTGDGGSLVLTSGTVTSGNAGNISITSSNGVGANKQGGNITVTGGNSTNFTTGGAITITSGSSGAGLGGNINLNCGAGTTSLTGSVVLGSNTSFNERAGLTINLSTALSTVDIINSNGNYLVINNTSGSSYTINSSVGVGTGTGWFGIGQAGIRRIVRFTLTSPITLTHNSSTLILPNNGSDINVATGDVATFVSLGGGSWICTEYQKANGASVGITDWALTGNSGTTAGTNFIGTSDSQELVFKTNGAERFRVSNSSSQIYAPSSTNIELKSGIGTATGNGGLAKLTGGAGGATSGDGGGVTIAAGSATNGAGGIALIGGGVGTGSNSGGDVNLAGGNSATGQPGTLNLVAGNSTGASGNGGYVLLTGGTCANSGGTGGGVTLTGGAGTGGGGNVWLKGGTPTSGSGLSGYILLQGGDATSTGTPGNANISAGKGNSTHTGGLCTVNGGDITGTSGNGGDIYVQAGQCGSSSGSGGSVGIFARPSLGNFNAGTVNISGGNASAGSSTSLAGSVALKAGNKTNNTSPASPATNGQAGVGGGDTYGGCDGGVAFISGGQVKSGTSITAGLAIVQGGEVETGSSCTTGSVLLQTRPGNTGTGTNTSTGDVSVITGEPNGTGTAGKITLNSASDIWLKTTLSGTTTTRFKVANNGQLSASTFYADGSLSIVSGVITSSSDKNKKDHVSNITYDEIKNSIMDLNPVRFKWKPELPEGQNDKIKMGFYAQEVENSGLNELVSQNAEGSYGLDQIGMLAPIVAFIQQQQRDIETLKQEIEDLKSKI